MCVLVHQALFLKRIVILGRKCVLLSTCIERVTDNLCSYRYGRLMWMHNGGIAEFDKIKRKLQSSLPEELFLFVEGNTDSEWAFALFLSFVSISNIYDSPCN